tara:strand:+ start:2075 stop:2203 length:129 start_codon:yes stop_codon:yes gene_type:complete
MIWSKHEMDDLDEELLKCRVCKKYVDMFDVEDVCFDCNRGTI